MLTMDSPKIQVTSATIISTWEWQLCPKCNGQGIVSKPPYVPGDVHQWSSTTQSAFICNLCGGTMKIARLVSILNSQNL